MEVSWLWLPFHKIWNFSSFFWKKRKKIKNLNFLSKKSKFHFPTIQKRKSLFKTFQHSHPLSVIWSFPFMQQTWNFFITKRERWEINNFLCDIAHWRVVVNEKFIIFNKSLILILLVIHFYVYKRKEQFMLSCLAGEFILTHQVSKRHSRDAKI